MAARIAISTFISFINAASATPRVILFGCPAVPQLLEWSRDELELWSPNLRKQVDTLVMQMKKREALSLVYRAEDYAQELSRNAQALQRYLFLLLPYHEKAQGTSSLSQPGVTPANHPLQQPFRC